MENPKDATVSVDAPSLRFRPPAGWALRMKGRRVGRIGPCACPPGSRLRTMHDGLERRLVEARKLRPKKASAGGVHPMAVDVPATTHLELVRR